jgi:hypothetical protein
MAVVCLERLLPLGALGVVLIYCPYKNEKSTAFDINPQRHHINKKNHSLKKKIHKLRKRKRQGIKAGKHKRDNKRKKRFQSG